MINADTPANPTGYATAFEGLTKREYFAGLAMQGHLSGGAHGEANRETIAAEAVLYADALLSELEK